MKESFKTHGAFRWCELMTLDPAAAERFQRHALRRDAFTIRVLDHIPAFRRSLAMDLSDPGSEIRVELNCGKGQASEDDPCIHKMGRSGR